MRPSTFNSNGLQSPGATRRQRVFVAGRVRLAVTSRQDDWPVAAVELLRLRAGGSGNTAGIPVAHRLPGVSMWFLEDS